MPPNVDRFVLLLDEYIGFVGDLPADAEFNGHFVLEDKINAEGRALGLGPVFACTESWKSPDGWGSIGVPHNASDDDWDKITQAFGDIEAKGYRREIRLTVYRPNRMGSTTYFDLPLRGFRDKENFTQKERTQFNAVLREWQRAARTEAAHGDTDRSARPKLTKREANIKARDYLRDNPNATVRELAERIECSSGLVSQLPAWKAVKEQRDKGRQPRTAAVVSLTSKLEQAAGVEDESLAKLIAEQDADTEPSPLNDDPPSDRPGSPRKAKVYRKR